MLGALTGFLCLVVFYLKPRKGTDCLDGFQGFGSTPQLGELWSLINFLAVGFEMRNPLFTFE